MAAPSGCLLRLCRKSLFSQKAETFLFHCKLDAAFHQNRFASSWTRFFKGSKEEETEVVERPRKLTKFDGPTMSGGLKALKKREGIYNVRGYSPPSDVEERTLSIASNLAGQDVTAEFIIDDRLLKFQLLTTLMQEFDHVIPNIVLTEMNTVGDVLEFFLTPVRDQSAFEDLAKLDLPKNLHIQMEPVRFDPETDTFFDGQTAFLGRPTIVTSLKYRRKYKGNSGESRNQRSKTNYEMEKELEADRDAQGKHRFPSEGIQTRHPNYKYRHPVESPIA